jgi:hypothetical protein
VWRFGASERDPKLEVWAWSLVGFVAAMIIVLSRSAIARLRSRGFFGQVAGRAESTLQRRLA